MIKLKDLKLQLIRSYGISGKNPLIRKRLRKAIARIKTEQNKPTQTSTS